MNMYFYPQPLQCGHPRDYIETTVAQPKLAALLEAPGTRELIMRDDAPIPAPQDRIQYYKENHLAYWLSGLADQRQIQTMSGMPGSLRVLDFGGSTGRVARHWNGEDPAHDVHLCDINPRFTTWVNYFLWPRVKAYKNTIEPHLHFEANSFDLVYAFSVFTHINEYELAWLQELRRIIRPGGRLLATIHNDCTWKLLPSLKFRIATEVLPGSPAYIAYCKERSSRPDRAAFVYREELVNVFYSNDYIAKYWSDYFEIEQIVDQAHNYQAMVVMRRRS